MDGGRQRGDEERPEKLSFPDTIHSRMIQGLALLAVFAVAFLLRAAVIGQPSIDPQDRSCLLDENGNPYFTEMDSYFYLRKAREMAEQDAAVWSVDRNEDSLIGQRTYGEYHGEAYAGPGTGYDRDREGKGGVSGTGGGVVIPLGLSALAFLIRKYFASPLLGASLTQTAIWMGPVFGSLAVFPAYWYVRRRTCFAGGLAAAVLTGCAIPFVLHTHAGFFDTDMILAVLPLTGILTLIRCMCEKDLRKQTLLALVSAAAFACMSRFWKAYYGYYLFALAGTGISTLILMLMPMPGRVRMARRSILRGGGLFFCMSLILLLVLNGQEAVLQIAGAPGALRKAVGSTDSMPYALQMIAEMQPLRFLPDASGVRLLTGLFTAGNRSMVGRLGGLIPCLLALGWIPAEIPGILKPGDSEERTAFLTESVFLGSWMAAGVYLTCFRGGRFAEIAVLPACILCGLTIGRLGTLLSKRAGRGRIFSVIALGLLVAAAVMPMAFGAWKAVRGTRSYVTDSKREALTWIRDNTSPDTALVSWWDDGYFMQYQARRRTLSDGGSDNGKLSWLVATALTTDDPDLMAGILRMVNESGTEALDDLTYAGIDQPAAARLLLRILSVDRAAAEETLKTEFGKDSDLIHRILDKTHPEKPGPLVLTLTTDLLQKFRSLGYFGFWNPDSRRQEAEAYILPSAESVLLQEKEEKNQVRIPMVDPDYELNLELEEEKTGLQIDKELQTDRELQTNRELQTDRPSSETGKIRFSAFYSVNGEQVIPGCLLVWEDGILLQEDLPDRDEGIPLQAEAADKDDRDGQDDRLAAVVLKEGNRFSALLCSENMCRSMLIRLMVCEDRSLDQAKRLGTWYSEYARDPSPAQQRINYLSWTSWSAQAWEIRQGGE